MNVDVKFDWSEVKKIYIQREVDERNDNLERKKKGIFFI